jgi:BMFP domain-containing protein YqiC
MDLLTRGELNAQVQSLKRTKQRIEELENLISELEKKIDELSAENGGP